MSWKPSRSSGVSFDKFASKAERFKCEAEQIITQNDVIKFEDINRLSMAFFLWWQNDNKADKALSGKGNKPFTTYYCSPYYLNIFKRNINLCYKPAQEFYKAI